MMLLWQRSLRRGRRCFSHRPETTSEPKAVALTRRAVTMLGSPQGQVILALTQLRNRASLRARREYWQARFERMRPIFDRAVARGEFPGNVEPTVMLQTLIAPLYFRLLVSVEKLDDWPVDELVDLNREMADKALQKGKAAVATWFADVHK